MKKLWFISAITLNLIAGQYQLTNEVCTNSNYKIDADFQKLKLAAEIENILYFIDDNELINLINLGSKITKSDLNALDFIKLLKQGSVGKMFYKIQNYLKSINNYLTAKLNLDGKPIAATERDLDLLFRCESLLINLKNNIKSTKIANISDSAREKFTKFINKILANICGQYSNALKN